MNVETIVKNAVKQAVSKLYGADLPENILQIQKTRKEFEGDYTFVVFPLLKISKKSPEITALEIGNELKSSCVEIEDFNIVKGFLNIRMKASLWMQLLNNCIRNKEYGFEKKNSSRKRIMLEYSSPNTNKPLHLGHVRNNLLGWSVAQILKACGHEVKMVNLVNDRGIHICKSMLAWQKFGKGETPESSEKKGDKLVGDYYVMFDREYKRQIEELKAGGVASDEAERTAPIFIEAQEMLRLWEAKDPTTIDLWKTMNEWVYEGFNQTYARLGISFDKIYYESNTYLLGKKIVEEGLQKNVFFTKDDGSVWIDLTADGLDQKLLLRSDGTSVYMTQDLGTAEQRQGEFHFDNMIYVVGNEQNYHFQVLKLILSKLGYTWATNIYHLSYGMVELPEGKMKSREGTVVDADELVEEMRRTAREMSEELGKLDEMSEQEAEETVNMIGLGALKYFILKVDPKKTMLFDPRESIDFNGNTGSFIQYAHARIKSILRKAEDFNAEMLVEIEPGEKERELIKLIADFPETLALAGLNYSPALIANYIYELVKSFNQFYHDFPILKEENCEKRRLRLALSAQIAEIIKRGMKLLGIDVPEKM
ncbi:MAG: arginine--tRNA ligase [Prevotellaceae bacterium]|jgi:arginyl-tRNA synthetase|nr:arginine--tRNA ligase [Prevotellaceae bacterium]